MSDQLQRKIEAKSLVRWMLDDTRSLRTSLEELNHRVDDLYKDYVSEEFIKELEQAQEVFQALEKRILTLRIKTRYL